MSINGKRAKKPQDPMVGQRFGKLVVIRRLPDRKGVSAGLRARMFCECDCGNRVVIPKAYLLRSNPRRDCKNCYFPIPVESVTFHPEYMIWRMMIQRCHSPKHVSYDQYGGNGVTVCPEWRASFEVFFKAVGRRPTPFHSLDRRDPKLGYQPGNVKWATATEQARNKRNTKYVEHPNRPGERIAAAALADELGVDYHELRQKLIAEGKW